MRTLKNLFNISIIIVQWIIGCILEILFFVKLGKLTYVETVVCFSCLIIATYAFDKNAKRVIDIIEKDEKND